MFPPSVRVTVRLKVILQAAFIAGAGSGALESGITPDGHTAAGSSWLFMEYFLWRSKV